MFRQQKTLKKTRIKYTVLKARDTRRIVPGEMKYMGNVAEYTWIDYKSL